MVDGDQVASHEKGKQKWQSCLASAGEMSVCGHRHGDNHEAHTCAEAGLGQADEEDGKEDDGPPGGHGRGDGTGWRSGERGARNIALGATATRLTMLEEKQCWARGSGTPDVEPR